MCGGSKPKTPEVQKATPPAPIERYVDAKVVESRSKTRNRAIAAAGRQGTILTSGLGSATTARKTLLGQ
ncbi:MAG: hypothetical protein CL561_00300 [Alphaproteobacteria bacterium]|nr:hypothetical protein [Alphaproteobacteria bacterium]|tara:strand:+ start:4649 stop:4855 length:207 start_codon:yes stop_codon:yes gene_type:complete